MKNIIIVGAGGFAKEILGYIEDDKQKGFLSNVSVKGILVDFIEDYHALNMNFNYLGKN